MLNKAARLGLAVLAVGLAVAVLVFRVGNGVETDLYGLADAHGGGALKEIAAGLAHQGRVLVEGPSGRPPVVLARAIASVLRQCPPGNFADTLEYLSRHKDGLLAPEARELLLSGRFADVAADSMARLFGPVHPLFPAKEDPFLLATGYAMSLQSRLAEGWTLKDGFPACEIGGRSWLLVTADMSEMSSAQIAEFIARAKAFNAGNTDFGVGDDGHADGLRVWCGGPPFHSACTAERAKREINLLSILSVAAVIVFGWLLLRTLRFLPSLLVAVGVAAIFAGAALFAAFPRPHVLTFVFGTSLIGLSVDYVYHAWAAGGARYVRRQLAYAMLTTVAAFAPLLLAAVDVLRQMALFSIAGLVAVWAWVSMFIETVRKPCRIPYDARTVCLVAGGRWRSICVLVALAVALIGIGKLEVVHSPAAFYRPDAYLAQSERKLAELNPSGGRFVYVRGKTLQEALGREESAGIKGISAVIPSIRRQKENRKLIARLHAKEGKAYSVKTGLKVKGIGDDENREDGDGGLLDPETVTDVRLQGMVRAAWTGNGLVSPCPEGFEPSDSEILVLEPKRSLEEMFARFTMATLRLLGISLIALILLTALLLRRRFLRVAVPVLAALAATAGILGWLGLPITFFTLLCVFVLAGLGIDYAIFQAFPQEAKMTSGEDCNATSRAVFYSFLTSFVGLGALTFTDFAVTHDMGVTFGVGLVFSYCLASIMRRSLPAVALAKVDGKGRRGEGEWHRQQEQSAGACRIWFLWLVYRWLGKSVQKVFCVPVMLFIYPFACPAKTALREFYQVLKGFNGNKGSNNGFREELTLFRHLLGFAWSLADKTDACTLKKSLPKMTVRDDAAWRSFASLTRSGKGAFIISSHLGTAEVLPALPSALGIADTQPHVHAFQQMGHDAEFTRVFMRHFDSSRLTLHAVEGIGVETAVAMQEAIRRGELVLMAGDRASAGSGKVLCHDFLGRNCAWPKGAFVFARLLEAPIFFVTCVRTGWNSYEAHFGHGGVGFSLKLEELLDAYVDFLERETLARPDQWFQFYDFFNSQLPTSPLPHS